jgi:hypothetical protein
MKHRQEQDLENLREQYSNKPEKFKASPELLKLRLMQEKLIAK